MALRIGGTRVKQLVSQLLRPYSVQAGQAHYSAAASSSNCSSSGTTTTTTISSAAHSRWFASDSQNKDAGNDAKGKQAEQGGDAEAGGEPVLEDLMLDLKDKELALEKLAGQVWGQARGRGGTLQACMHA